MLQYGPALNTLKLLVETGVTIPLIDILVELIDVKGIGVAYKLYGCEAVRHKLKNSLKKQKMHFLPVVELMSDSLTTV